MVLSPSGFESYLQLCHRQPFSIAAVASRLLFPHLFGGAELAVTSGSTPRSSYIQGCRYGATLLCVDAVDLDHLRCGYICIANIFCLRCLLSYKLACTLHHELCSCVTGPVSRLCHRNSCAGCCCLGAIVESLSREARQRQASPLVRNSVSNVL